jgi:hypothetical protein
VTFETARAATIARRYLASRRRRSELFEPGLFADPAWDMLLDLFAANAEGRTVSVSSACLAAGVAPSTAAGWLRQLERQGLVTRHPDPADGRRALLEIGPDASLGIERWLNATFLQ